MIPAHKTKTKLKMSAQVVQALISAAYMGNAEEVAALIEAGATVNQYDEHGESALMVAVVRGHEAVVKIILAAQGVKVDLADKKNITPLMEAVYEGHVKIVKLLLEAGANVNAEDSDGQTPLMRAAIKGNEKILEILLAATGIQLNHVSKLNSNALGIAIKLGHPKFAQKLAEAMILTATKGNLLYTTVCYDTPTAKELTEFLIKKKADIEMGTHSGGTPLMAACSLGHLAHVKMLCDAKANVNAINNNNTLNALKIATLNGFYPIVQYLISKGADVNKKDNNNETVLMFAINAVPPNLEFIQMLLDAGADISAHNLGGATAVTVSILKKNLAVVKLLMDSCLKKLRTDNQQQIVQTIEKAYLSTQDCSRALDVALADGHHEVATALLICGASLDFGNHVQTPLFTACANKDIHSVELMLRRKVNLELGNKYQQTPLMMACNEGSLPIVKLLCEAKADVNAKDYDRGTPLKAAIVANQFEIALYLLKNGAVPISYDKNGENDLLFAVRPEQASRELVQALIDTKLDFYAKSQIGTTVLNLCVNNGQDHLIPLVLKAMRSKMDPEGEMFKGMIRHAFVISFRFERESCFEFFLKDPALAAIIKEFLPTAFRIAIYEGLNKGILFFLKRKLIDLNANQKFEDTFTTDTGAEVAFNEGIKPLMIAAMHGEVKILRELIRYGADVDSLCRVNISDTPDPILKSALTLAQQQDESEAVQFLFECKILKEIKNIRRDSGLAPRTQSELDRMNIIIKRISQEILDMDPLFDVQARLYVPLEKLISKGMFRTESHRTNATLSASAAIISQYIHELFEQTKSLESLPSDIERLFWKIFYLPFENREKQDALRAEQQRDCIKILQQLELQESQISHIIFGADYAVKFDKLVDLNAAVHNKAEKIIQDCNSLLSTNSEILASKHSELNSMKLMCDKFRAESLQYSENILKFRQELVKLQRKYQESRQEVVKTIRIFVEKQDYLNAIELWGNFQKDENIKSLLSTRDAIKVRLNGILLSLQSCNSSLSQNCKSLDSIKKNAEILELKKADEALKLEAEISKQKEHNRMEMEQRSKHEQEEKERFEANIAAFRQVREELEKRLLSGSDPNADSDKDTKDTLDNQKPSIILGYQRKKISELTLSFKGAINEYLGVEKQLGILEKVLNVLKELEQNKDFSKNLAALLRNQSAVLGVAARAMEIIKEFKPEFCPYSPEKATKFRDAVFHAFELYPEFDVDISVQQEFSKLAFEMVSAQAKFIRAVQDKSDSEKLYYAEMTSNRLFKKIEACVINNTPSLAVCLKQWERLKKESACYSMSYEENLVLKHALGFTAGCAGAIAALIRKLYPEEFKKKQKEYMEAIKKGKSYRHIRDDSEVTLQGKQALGLQHKTVATTPLRIDPLPQAMGSDTIHTAHTASTNAAEASVAASEVAPQNGSRSKKSKARKQNRKFR